MTLVAAGGRVATPDAADRALRRCFQTWRPVDDRLDDIRLAFFARESEIPEAWRQGWYPMTATIQGAATRNTPVDLWWQAGQAPVLVLQALEDVIAPPGNADILERELGERVTRVDVPGAGHALLPEQPEKIAAAIIGFVQGQKAVATPR